MLNVYFIRHGQSESNLNATFSGNTDVPLTDKGRDDARHAGELLKGIEFQKIYVSNLSRAQETMRLAIPGAVGVVDERLQETNVGFLAGHLRSEMMEKYGDALQEAFRTRCFGSYGGEQQSEHMARVKAFRDMLEAENIDGNVAVFAHDGTIRNFFQLMVGNASGIDQVRLANGSVSVFSYNGKYWILKHWNLI